MLAGERTITVTKSRRMKFYSFKGKYRKNLRVRAVIPDIPQTRPKYIHNLYAKQAYFNRLSNLANEKL